MAPIFTGIIASSKPTAVAALSGFVGIDSYTFANSSLNTVTFSNIPQGYKHLYIVFTGQGTVNDGMRLYFNGDTGASNYIGTSAMFANASTAGAYANNGTGIVDPFSLLGSSYGATQNTAGYAYINDYSKSNKIKAITSFQSNLNSANEGGLTYGVGARVSSTAAITSLTFTARTGNFNTNSKFALFGVN